MATSFLSNDSLDVTLEIEILKDKLKQKDKILNEKSEIISSLRQQVQDLNHDNEELENKQQVLYQKIDRLTRELDGRNEELEALSHALKEIGSANESLQKRYDARLSQIQKFADDLVQTKKELEETQVENEQLKHKQEQLTVGLELANSKKRSSLTRELDEKSEQLKHKLKISPQDENSSEPIHAMHLTMAEEVGEFMEPSSSLRNGMKSLSHEIKSFEYDPIIEYKNRVARANELARRNMQTKPLHQTSYALELDTFDTMNLTEHEIKRGNIKHPKLPSKNQQPQLRQPPQRQPPQPPRQRQALANFSNTPPKRVYKKAEAFIV